MPVMIQEALHILAVVLIYAAAWFIGWTSLMGVSAMWKKLKRNADKEQKDYDWIIVKRQEEEKKNSELQLEILAKQKTLEQLSMETARLDALLIESVKKVITPDAVIEEQAEENKDPEITPAVIVNPAESSTAPAAAESKPKRKTSTTRKAPQKAKTAT